MALDTNFLLWSVRQKVNALAEIRKLLGNVEFIVPTQVERELELLKKEGKTMQKWIGLAEEELRANKAEIVPVAAGGADAALEKLAAEGCLVATNDKALKARLKQRVIFIRQNKLIEITGG